MYVIRFCSAVACGALLFMGPSAYAQDLDVPTYTVLKCETGCSLRTRPTADGEHRGYYPAGELQAFPQYKSEAFVLIRYTITADGTVKDPVVERLIGPQNFADGSIAAIKEWRYHPATLNGRPVPTYNWMTEMIYEFTPPERGAREKVYDAYGKARSLVKEGKFADAKAVLLPILSLDRLNFYERSMVSYLLALIDVQLKDYMTAREFIEDATVRDGKFLGDPGRNAAIRLRIQIDGLTGQYGDALEWYEKLKKRTQVTADDPDAKLIDKIQARLADQRPILIVGRIPVSGYLDPWSHVLLRRNFAFPKIEGKADRFQLRCDQEEIESPITDKAEWHVPKNWSNCHLEVFGTPGALFQLGETND